MAYFCWHGVGGYSLYMDGLQITLDPFFADVGGEGPWFKGNLHRPTLDQYSQLVNPHIIIITHGHYDHCCIKTIREITEKKEVLLVAGKNVLDGLERYGVVSDHTGIIEAVPGEELEVAGVKIESFPGAHWQQGGWGDRLLKLYGRGRGWKGLPISLRGGAQSYLLSRGKETVFCSGDTLLDLIPDIRADLVIANLGTYLLHPITGRGYEPILTLQQLPLLARWLQCKTLIPVHFDWREFVKWLTVQEIERYLGRVESTCRFVMPEPNQWVSLT